MALYPITEEELVARYGAQPQPGNAGRLERRHRRRPRRSRPIAASAASSAGSSSRSRRTQVVGFEPWYEFPFDEGKLCPKGVKRYLQNAHPDRLSSRSSAMPAIRAGSGRCRDHALDRTVSEIQRIQQPYGNGAFAMLPGVSLDNEGPLEVARALAHDASAAAADLHERIDRPNLFVKIRPPATTPPGPTSRPACDCRAMIALGLI